MAKLYNIARMSTATTGTGTITLGSASSGFLSFAGAGVSNGETVTYGIEDGASREIGRGVYTSSGTTLTRTVLKSTNSDTAISLSGTAEVFITPAKEDIANLGENNVFTGVQQVTTVEIGHASDTTLSRASAGVVAVEGVNLLSTATGRGQGKETIWIPASAMWARTTAGATAKSAELTTGGDIMIKGWAFDTTTEWAVQGYLSMPKSWNKSTITAQFFWSNTGGSAAQTVDWGFSAGAYTDDDAMDTTDLGTEITTTDTYLAQNDLHVSAESSAITVGNTPIDGDLIIFQVARKVATDNLAGNADLLGVKIFFTTSASTDA